MKRIVCGIIGLILVLASFIIIDETLRPLVRLGAVALFMVGGTMLIFSFTADEPSKRPSSIYGPSRPTAPPH